MSEETATPAVVTDPWGQAASIIGKGPGSGTILPAGTPAAPPAPRPQPIPGVPGPWPHNGKKYPNALDYKQAPGAMAWCDRVELIGAPPGLADKTGFGAALYATELYYGSNLDIHPLVQLGVAGAAFGFGWAKGTWEAKKAEGPKANADAAKLAADLGGL